MRIERHPLGIWVREDGCIYLPKSGRNPAHWTFGSKNSDGYRKVKIAGKTYLCHRLVVEAFIQYPIPSGFEIDHISRDKSANMVTNLRIVSHSQNIRNTSAHDRVTERGGTHVYDDYRQAHREYVANYKQSKNKTHRRILFANGSTHWIPHAEAEAYLKIPLKQRIFAK